MVVDNDIPELNPATSSAEIRAFMTAWYGAAARAGSTGRGTAQLTPSDAGYDGLSLGNRHAGLRARPACKKTRPNARRRWSCLYVAVRNRAHARQSVDPLAVAASAHDGRGAPRGKQNHPFIRNSESAAFDLAGWIRQHIPPENVDPTAPTSARSKSAASGHSDSGHVQAPSTSVHANMSALTLGAAIGSPSLGVPAGELTAADASDRARAGTDGRAVAADVAWADFVHRCAGGRENTFRESERPRPTKVGRRQRPGPTAQKAKRRAALVADLDAAAAAAGCRWNEPGGKLEEVLFLVERPSVITGDILPEHLRLPKPVLVTAMQSHQRYFPLERPDGSLEPRFLAVSNGDPAHAQVITRGNADVLDARLQDAAFSFDRDREAGLAALDERLATIVFHKRLGSMADKRDRLAASAAEIADAVGLDSAAVRQAGRAGQLAKVDQGAVLVAEFSDLQGYVGAEYAAREGEDDAVVVAVREHYLPEGPDSPAPSTDVAACVALAEKLDNLIGAFLAGEVPSGSKDPYGLRRAAAGLVRILIERGWDVDLDPITRTAAARLVADGVDLPTDTAPALAELEGFIADRVAFLLAADGVNPE